jgi:phosphatidylglycerophosphate synthase
MQVRDVPSWATKPTDRFVLKWIKINLSARITPHLRTATWIRPWHVSICSMMMGVIGGFFFGLGFGFTAGVLAALGQVLDGVDGQYARMTQTESRAGAYLDSVLDRYSDGAMVIGLSVFVINSGTTIAEWGLYVLSYLAIVGSGLVSYGSARAEALHLSIGKPTLASKGTRTSVMIAAGLTSPIVPEMATAALIYLAIHPNGATIYRLLKASRRQD